MQTETKAEQLITKLIRETAANRIDWEIKQAPVGLVQGTDDVVPLFLQTTFKGKDIGVYQKRFKSYIDEHDYCWTERVGFCITDIQGRVLWELEERSPALYELFTTAREQASGIGSLLDDLLDS